MLAAVTLTCLAAVLLQSAPVSAATFGAPVVISGNDANEPGIDIAPDGTLYVHAPPGLLSTPPFSPGLLWRSNDAGATWAQTPFGARAVLPGGGDTDVAVAPDGSLAWSDLWLGSSTVGRSADGGDTWEANPVQGTLVQDRQWLANVGGGVVYHASHQVPAGIAVARSVDGGLTYPTQTVAATLLDGCICPSGPVIAEPGTPLVAGRPGTSVSDKVGVVYYNGGAVRFARSTDSGQTWTQSNVTPPSFDGRPGAFPVVANAGGGVLVAVWHQEPALVVAQTAASAVSAADETGKIGFSISYDWGASWASPQAIVSSGSSVFPWVDARGTTIGVSLFHTTATGRPDMVGESAEWHEAYLESSTTSPTVWSPLQVVDPAPVKTGPICTAGLNCGSDRELGDFQSLVIDHAGRPNIVYTRSIDNESDTEVRFVRGS